MAIVVTLSALMALAVGRMAVTMRLEKLVAIKNSAQGGAPSAVCALCEKPAVFHHQ